ncbi:hypothetical protein [Roseateles amylovorans]|uniref:Uncharacterized protein n=1 Tax=Roseateles amylovorans TaxID=2978473 RepID=A0ABY6AZ47_9BURK|nr:hypothetical protein [Roseateles amylovorans]UXH77166.1 hypothetical protein N4261_19420 [Roseateles amylovorans]
MRFPRRFDEAWMHPPDAAGVVDAALALRLRAWCEGGAFPSLTEPLRVASTAPHPALDGAACALDGSHELARRGRWRGLLWRMQILWRDCAATGALATDPWDCGWWRPESLGLAAAFRPRRATLLMVRDVDRTAAVAWVSTLREGGAADAYEFPVRVLVVSTPALGGMSRL